MVMRCALVGNSINGYMMPMSHDHLAFDVPIIYSVVTSKSHSITDPLPNGAIYRINTGGPLPAGADAVIMVEDTRLISVRGDEEEINVEEEEVETLAQLPAGENVRKPGSDVQKGDLVFQAGERILDNGGEIGTLAFIGCKEVRAALHMFCCDIISAFMARHHR